MFKYSIYFIIVIIIVLFIIENFNNVIQLSFFGYNLIKTNETIIILISLLLGFIMGLPFYIKTKYFNFQKLPNNNKKKSNDISKKESSNKELTEKSIQK